MYLNILTVVAVAISSIVVLITLGRISRQSDLLNKLLKSIDQKLTASKAKEDISASQIQRQIHDLNEELKMKKGNIDWKG